MSAILGGLISGGLSMGGALGSAAMGNKGAKDAQKKQEKMMEAIQNINLGNVSRLDQLKGDVDSVARQGRDNFAKYEQMLGPIEDTMENYYMNLNPDELAAQGNQTAQQQYQQSMNSVNDQLAANGMLDAGTNAQLQMQGSTNLAQQKSQNIMNSPHQVAQKQQEWLGYVSGKNDNAYNQMNQGLQNQMNHASQYQMLGGSAMNQAGNMASQYV